MSFHTNDLDTNVPEMQEQEDNNYQYRKIQPIQGGISMSIILPKSYATKIGLKKDGFVKVYHQNNKIIVERA